MQPVHRDLCQYLGYEIEALPFGPEKGIIADLARGFGNGTPVEALCTAKFQLNSEDNADMNKGQLLDRSRGIIIAADVNDISELRKLTELSMALPEVVAIKIGFSLGLRYGLPAVTKAIADVAPLPIIYDHQKAGTDIPQMGKPFASVCADAGIQGVIFFPLSGPKTLRGFVSAATEANLVPIVGLVMTHPAFLQSEGGFIADTAPDTIVRIAIDMGVSNYVLPGTKTEIVERFSQGPLAAIQPANIMMPGIGSQGGTITSAFRAASPHHAFAIVGSALYNNPDPSAVLQAMITEIDK